MRILAIGVAVVLGTAVSMAPASLGRAQSNQVATLLTFDFSGEAKKKERPKATSPKGKHAEGGNSSYVHRPPGNRGKAAPKWSDIELKRGR
jgi:hypothetical protein